MAVGIECPICEARFLVKQVGPKIGIRCPECQRKFRFSKEILVNAADADQVGGDPEGSDSTLRSTREETADLKPIRKGVSRKPKLATLPPTSDSAELKISEQAALGGVSSGSVESIRETYRKRAKRQTLTSTAIGVVGVVAICILSVVLYRQLNASDSPETSDATQVATSDLDLSANSSSSQSMTSASSRADQQPQQLQPAKISGKENAAPVAVERLPERELDYFTEREIDRVWEGIRPRLISLSVRTDQGKVPAVGTIVDSRGWALVSHRLAGKWPEVSVTASAANLDAYREHLDAVSGKNPDGQKLLTDTSRGLVATQPKLDLALLAVNPRFVVALDEVKILPRTRVVSGLFLAQVAPPSTENPYGAEEIEVLAKQKHDELESEARFRADDLGINDPTIDWVVTEKKGTPSPGTPALDKSGAIAARFVFSTRLYAYYLPADDASTAVQLASDSGDSKPKTPVTPETELISVDHPMARPSELMNRAGNACEQFSWMPHDDDEFLQLQKFSRRISTVQKFIRDNQDKESESVVMGILSNHITRWQKSMSRSLGNPKILTDVAVTQFNQLALKQLNRRTLTTGASYIPFFAEVYSAGIDEENRDSILLQIGDQVAFVRVPFDGRDGLRPGSLWLCFFKRDTKLNKKTLKLESGGTAPFFTGKLSLVLGPFKR